MLGLSLLRSLSRMAPQPHMMSDLSHQSVPALTAQQLYNCGFSISVLTSTKSPYLLSSESDLLTDARSAQAPRPISSGHAPLRRRLVRSCRSLGRARCAWPGLPLWRKEWTATPSTHSIQPSWLYRTRPIVTSRACLCRCASVLRSHDGRVVSTSLQHDEGVSKPLKHPPLALVPELLVQFQPRTFPKTDGSQRSPRTFNPNFWLMLILPRRRTFRPPLVPFADDDGLGRVSRLATQRHR